MPEATEIPAPAAMIMLRALDISDAISGGVLGADDYCYNGEFMLGGAV